MQTDIGRIRTVNKISRIAAALVVAVASLLTISGCSDDKFNVGDCVIAKRGFRNDKMEKTDCRKTTMQEKLDDKGVYRISKIVPLRSGCPRGTDITFNHEPRNATYCLNEY